MKLFFAYGELLDGGPFRHLLADSRFIAKVKTEPGYRLCQLRRSHIADGDRSFLVSSDPGTGYSVAGDLFRCSTETITRIRTNFEFAGNSVKVDWVRILNLGELALSLVSRPVSVMADVGEQS